MCLTVIQVAKRPRSVSLACGCMASRQAKSLYIVGKVSYLKKIIFGLVIGRLAVLKKQTNEKIYFLYKATFAIKSCFKQKGEKIINCCLEIY